LLAGLERRIESRAPRADDDRVKFVDHVFLLLLDVMASGIDLPVPRCCLIVRRIAAEICRR
jgi:hypothetical protein